MLKRPRKKTINAEIAREQTLASERRLTRSERSAVVSCGKWIYRHPFSGGALFYALWRSPLQEKPEHASFERQSQILTALWELTHQIAEANPSEISYFAMGEASAWMAQLSMRSKQFDKANFYFERGSRELKQTKKTRRNF